MENFKEFGAIGGLIALGYVLIKETFALIGRRGNGIDKTAKVIETNHLPHLYDEMKHHTVQHDKMLENQSVEIQLLTKIATILEERK
jgi:hypothetical protein